LRILLLDFSLDVGIEIPDLLFEFIPVIFARCLLVAEAVELVFELVLTGIFPRGLDNI
jgi:hypothetical protein